ncbi:MAG TPA: 3-phosphoshikimate 1-carboxyvinyltransferase [Bacillota bacterium]|nr:3-phosphoshikimate 1-carboxyvinyltransferase [Candidatus Fermentithermobacillaceae bacterium]HOK65068.1 3-phosphoshikimate 1-carboxyvinyltransferase [Bacillota bacterium]HOL12340.1 3-phosphoshikimate 1-carboxyvinyltransferase [Bacillota bacterium]HPP61269.1 3-phosphoshikimate 1-carboxyvinyltransferase [Bacillota bacterium]
METVTKPNKGISGCLRVPGDKSISHRAAIVGAIATGTTEIIGYASGLDCSHTLTCLEKLGVTIERSAENRVLIQSAGPESLEEPDTILDAGNSGTTMRLLAGVLASIPFCSVITGDSSLRNRPMDRIVEPLRQMGACICGRKDSCYAPLMIKGENIHGICYQQKIASAQVKSAILLAGMNATGYTILEELYRSRDHTERLLKWFGAQISTEGMRTTVTGKTRISGRRVTVPGDISSAAYFLALAAATPESDLTILDVSINPTRTGFVEILQDMGANIALIDEKHYGFEPVASLKITGSALNAIEVRPEQIPNLIDEIPVLAVVCTQAEGVTRISGAQELRLKESDRLTAITKELNKMGANIQETSDGLIIKGPTPLFGTNVETYGDHRIAMAMAVAGSLAQGTTTINGADCVDVSFPGFWDLVEQVKQ